MGFRGGPKFFEGPGEYEVKGVFITGIATYHDGRRGASRGRNTAYLYEFDGVSICHLGDLGHVPDQDQVQALSDLSVLLIPVGGTFTVDAKEASEIVTRLNPRIVVPMHFKTSKCNLPIEGVEAFLE